MNNRKQVISKAGTVKNIPPNVTRRVEILQ
jgi:hypothetical protein